MAKLCALLLALTGFATLTACNTVEGAGRDVEAAGRAIEDTAQDTEDELND